MPRVFMFGLFFLVGTLVLGSAHYYLYRRLVIDPALPQRWRRRLKIALIALLACIPLSFVIARVVDNHLSRYFVFPVYVWLGVMVVLFFTLLPIDAVRGIHGLVRRVARRGPAVADPERRRFFARVIAGTVSGTTLAATVGGIWHGLGTLVIRRVEVPLPKLPKAFDGFTIAQLTDVHLGPMRQAEWMAEVVRRTNALSPDLVAITGDLVDGSVAQLRDDVAPLTALKAAHGVYFVTGNHEYFVDVDGWLKHLSSLGIRVLRNERVTIRRGGAVFDLAGIDDHEGKRFAKGHGADVPKAMKGRDPTRASVLLAHQPRVADEAAAHDIGLVLSGHTHGGQILLWRYLVYLQQPYVDGLHNHKGTRIYVSSGTGFWGPPMRLGSTAEIALITLRAR